MNQTHHSTNVRSLKITPVKSLAQVIRNKFTVAGNHEPSKPYKFRTVVSLISSFVVNSVLVKCKASFQKLFTKLIQVKKAMRN